MYKLPIQSTIYFREQKLIFRLKYMICEHWLKYRPKIVYSWQVFLLHKINSVTVHWYYINKFLLILIVGSYVGQIGI